MALSKKLIDIKSGKLTAVQNVSNFLDKIEKSNKELNIYLHLNPEALKKAEEIDLKIKNKKSLGKLAGLCVAVKSNICVEGLITNCASKVLEDFVAPYDATIIKRLKEEDAIILGMVNMDEFACGGSGETSAFGLTKNPFNKEVIPGGSSSGSAAAISANLCDFAIGSDTGGSIRNPASHCNVVGLKPSYGAISRYGLLDLSMSLDCIGIITKDIEDSKLIFDIVKGEDDLDTTTKRITETKLKEKYTIGFVNIENFATSEIEKLVKNKINNFAKNNDFTIKEIDLPLDIAVQTYYLMVYIEFFSATRKYDGRRFGKLIEDFAGTEVLRRILGGKEISKAEYEGEYYREAIKAKEYIRQKFEELFKEVDLIVLPTVPKLASNLGEKLSLEEVYAQDVFTTPISLAGIPGISIPLDSIDKKAIGIQIVAPYGAEDWIFDLGKKLEKSLD